MLLVTPLRDPVPVFVMVTVPPLTVTLLPAASLRRTVSVEVEVPFAAIDVGDAAIDDCVGSAAPATTRNAFGKVPEIEPPAVPWKETRPESSPVTVNTATPELAGVTLDEGVTVPRPAPPLFVSVTELVKLVTVLSLMSLIVAVTTRVAPDVRFAFEAVRLMLCALPGTTSNVSVSGVRLG